jgi:hypothetical protein
MTGEQALGAMVAVVAKGEVVVVRLVGSLL